MAKIILLLCTLLLTSCGYGNNAEPEETNSEIVEDNSTSTQQETQENNTGSISQESESNTIEEEVDDKYEEEVVDEEEIEDQTEILDESEPQNNDAEQEITDESETINKDLEEQNSENQEDNIFQANIIEEISEDYLENSNFEKNLKDKSYQIGEHTFQTGSYTHKINRDICILDNCFVKGTPVNIKNNGIIFTPAFPSNQVWYNPDNLNYYTANQSSGPGEDIVHKKFTYNNTEFTSLVTSSCGGTNYRQSVNNEFSGAPEMISYGNVDFYLQDLNFEGKSSMMLEQGPQRLGFGQDLIRRDKSSNTISIDNLEEKFAEYVEKKQKINTTYYVYLLDFPGVIFPYTTKTPASFGLYHSDKILENGNIVDIETAKKIYEKMGNYHVLSHENQGTIPEPSDEILTQLFRVQQVKESQYLVYLNDKYSLQSMAEMCKPLVYIYDKDSQNMSLKLDTIKDSEFTKLIPDFQEKNTWNFSTKNNKVFFGNTSYDYLYYAIKVPNYTHNEDGWIIQGSQAQDFFEDKLSYMGFNQQEKADFIEYWTPKYEKNKYYFVSFKFNQELDTFVKLEFSQKPNSIFRVLLDSYEIDDKLQVPSKFWYENTGELFNTQLLETYTRTGKYDVFEWGGVLQTFDKKYIK